MHKIVAITTPFLEDDKLDIASFKNEIIKQINAKTDALVLFGTTGEGQNLSLIEKENLTSIALDLSQNKIKIIVATGSNSTFKTIENNNKLHKNIAAALCVVPFYNKPDQEGLYLHFLKIAQNSKTPIILYDVPSRVITELDVKTIAKLAKHPNIIGLKDATGNLAKLAEIKKLVDDKFLLLSGDDATFFDYLTQGGNGFISVSANIVPKKMNLIYDLIQEKNISKAELINNELLNLHKDLFLQTNPIVVKSALNILGHIKTMQVRLPLISANKTTQIAIKKSLQEAHLL